MVVAHVKRMRVLQRPMCGALPRLQVLQPHLEVAAFRVSERTVILQQAHRAAQLIGHQPHRRAVRVGKRGVEIEPDVRISRHRAIEHGLGWQPVIGE